MSQAITRHPFIANAGHQANQRPIGRPMPQSPSTDHIDDPWHLHAVAGLVAVQQLHSLLGPSVLCGGSHDRGYGRRRK